MVQVLPSARVSAGAPPAEESDFGCAGKRILPTGQGSIAWVADDTPAIPSAAARHRAAQRIWLELHRFGLDHALDGRNLLCQRVGAGAVDLHERQSVIVAWGTAQVEVGNVDPSIA